MSEYWKSTPKYWCKHCNAYVKDTPFERKQHESTAKHQGNLKRFLRGIQNDHERNEREKDKVKAEVERLNKVVGGTSSATLSTTKQPAIRKTASSTLSVADQKKQWAQLAEMGIQVPDGFRGDMALPGHWQKIAERSLEESSAEPLSTGIRKRKYEGQEEEEEAGEVVVRRGWGSTTRRYPGDSQPDLDTLLSGPIIKKEKQSTTKEEGEEPHRAEVAATKSDSATSPETELDEKVSDQKQRDAIIPDQAHQADPVKGEPKEKDESPTLATIPEIVEAPVFKKRKAKAK